jgi:hypothetical protein
MSLHTAAKYLQSQGRNNDSMLVHMSPREVKGLQQLAMATGGSLTINPQTGLAEAGWLDSLIPMLGGAALMMIPGVGPLAAAGMMGAGYGIATGSLEKGLLAGLSAYGGANLGAGLAEAGGSALAQQGAATGANLGTEAVTQAAVEALPQGWSTAGNAFSPTEMLAGSSRDAVGNAISSTLTPQNFANLAPEQLSAMQSAVPGAANPMDISRAAGAANATTGLTPTQTMGAGFNQVTSSGSNAVDFLGNNKMNLALGAGPAVISAFGQQNTTDGTMTPEEESKLKRISPNFRAQAPIRPNPYYQAQYPTYAAKGGLMAAYQEGGPVERMTQMNTAINPQGGLYPQGMIDKTQYATPIQRPTSLEVLEAGAQRTFASGGIARYAPGGVAHLPVKGVYSDSDADTAKKPADQAAMIRLNKALAAANLPKAKMPKTNIKGLGDIPEVEAAGGGMMKGIGGYSDGGRMLKGPGDGMSDSIPAVIGSKQPARLADGEFVVPADVVSHLGNGSTDAGAKKLYGMMDKIRKARTGTKKQGKKINPNKFLPA